MIQLVSLWMNYQSALSYKYPKDIILSLAGKRFRDFDVSDSKGPCIWWMFSWNIVKSIYEKHENRDFHPNAARSSRIDVSHEINEKTDASKEASWQCWFSPYVSRLDSNRLFRWLIERQFMHLKERASGMRRADGRDLGRASVSHIGTFASPVWHALLPRDESQRGGAFNRSAHSAGPD